MFVADVQHICPMKPSTQDLNALKEQLKALDNGYVELLIAKLGGNYTGSYIRLVLSGDRRNNSIIDAALELRGELAAQQQQRLDRLKAFATEKAA
jgi:hypothetical protein